jgi:PAS domain S-box-containing protein
MNRFTLRSDAQPVTVSSEFQNLQVLQCLWETVSYGIYLLDVLEDHLDDGDEFRFAAFNPAIARTSPMPVEQLLCKTLGEALPNEQAQVYRQHYRRCVQSGQPLTFEEYFEYEGQETWWLLTVNPLLLEGKISQLLVTAIDITERARLERDRQNAEAALIASEAKFRRLIEDAEDMLGVWGLDGNLTYLSPSVQTHFGLSPAELLGKSFVPLVHPDDVETCFRVNQEVRETGESRSNIKFRNKTGDGGWIWVSMNISPIKDENQQVIAFQGVLRNIDEAKRLEQQIAAQRALFDSFFEGSNVGLAIMDKQLRFIHVNETLAEMNGLPAADHLGKTIAELLPDLTDTLMPMMQNILDTGIPSLSRELTGEIPTQPGVQHDWLISHYPLRDENQNIAGVGCVVIDISDRKAAEATLKVYAECVEQTLKELQRTQAQVIQSEKMSSLGQLVAGIAHEINNPVNFIHGNLCHTRTYAQDLLELIELYQELYPTPPTAIANKIAEIDLEFLSEDLHNILTSMQGGTERIREIVKSLRLFSRLDEAEVKSVNIHDGIDSALMILDSRLKAKGDRSSIQVIKTYRSLPEVECFAGQLNQVFMNILLNAIDALEVQPTSSSRIIHITTAVIESNQIEIRFEDNGCGIDASIQSQIFDPFFTTKPVGKGTGMGMSIAYQIITETHKGQITCQSAPGEGAEFIIQIPITHADY